VTLVVLLITFIVFLTIGMPIAMAMGVSGLAALLTMGHVPLVIMVQRLYSGIDSWSLMAIPLFLLAGELMSGANLTRQLVRFTAAFVRGVPAGTATVDVGSSMLFAGVSGSGTADMAAVGSVLIPRLIQRGYPRGFAAALEASSGALGPIIPPSLFIIIYAGIAGVSVGKLFLGGIVPGVLAAIGLVITVQFLNRRHRWEPRQPFGPVLPALQEMLAATVNAIPALMVPVIIVGGIVGGVFTPTESGGIAAFYALVLGLVTRRMTIVSAFKCIHRATITTIQMMLPVTGALLFGWILAREGFAAMLTNALMNFSQGNKWVSGIAVVLMLVVIGFPIEGMTLLLVFTPVLAPIGPSLGFDPIHWGMLIVLAINLAGITPPVGGGIFLCAGIAHATVDETVRWMWPFLITWVLLIILVLFVEPAVTLIPNALLSF
jgi:C4-dicarboxylate transporter DctM subunit